MWVLACYLAGNLMFSATFSYEGACYQEAARMQSRNPGYSCRCAPRQVYRPKDR